MARGDSPDERASTVPGARPLRVAHVMATFHVGGIERIVLQLATRCAAHGVASIAVAHVEDGLLRSAFHDAGVPTRFVDSDPGYSPSVVLRLARLFAAERIDVVHAHHFAPLAHAAPAAALAGCGFVYTEHSNEVYDAPRRRWLARMLTRGARVVCVSPELSTWHREHLGTSPTVIENGVDMPAPLNPGRRADVRASLGLGPGDIAFACVARLVEDKGVGHLLHALPSVARPVSLVIVGSGPHEHALRAQAAALRLDGRVRFLGQRSDVSTLLGAVDGFVLPSLREGLPVALLEAMAAGLPCVATRVGGIAALLEPDRGTCVAPGAATPLATALDAYAASSALRSAHGAAAAALVRARYSAEAMTARYVDVYRAAAR